MNKILYLDVETTGIEEEDRICQVAYKLPNEKGKQKLFKPIPEISIEAMSITHITNEDVSDEISFKGSNMFNDIKDYLENEAIFVAHNAPFDIRFLEKEGIKVDKYICTLKIAHHFDKNAELGRYNLQYLRYYYKLVFGEKIQPHEALSDVLVLEGLFQFYLKHYTIEEMVKISSKPILIKKIMFGKHNGQFFKDIAKNDLDYLLWMRRSMNLDENMKYTLDHYINNR